MKQWEIIADNLHNTGWSLGWVSALDLEGRTIIIICLKHPKTLALWLREPLAAVGIMDNIGKRVVSDDIINQVITSSIAKLVRLLWRMNDYVANANGYGFGWRS